MKKDRLGYLRCDGYKEEDFVLCELCKDKKAPDIHCKKCGGYGEYPRFNELMGLLSLGGTIH